MTRKPIVSGQFYAADFNDLTNQIQDCFQHEKGPGDLPLKERNKPLLAVIAPHAGYVFSGPCQAWVYKEIAESEFPDLYIILGVNHSGIATCSSEESWETPFGRIAADTEFISQLSSNGIPINNPEHQNEHSIEVQLPFLQFSAQSDLKRLRIAPIMIADSDYKKWADAIEKTLKQTKKKAVIICSSDFTHYGPDYDYTPFTTKVREKVKALDLQSASFIKDLDPEGFLKFTDEKRATICGRYNILVTIELIRRMKPDAKAELLNYYMSGDIAGDYKNTVGYAAIIIK